MLASALMVSIFYVFCVWAYLVPLLSLAQALLKTIGWIIALPVRWISRKYHLQTPHWQKSDSKPHPFQFLNQGLGMFEYYLRPFRNWSVAPFFIAVLCFNSLGTVLWGAHFSPLTGWGLPFFFLALTFYTVQQDLITSLKMAELLRMHPTLHPKTFFEIYYSLTGPFAYKIPDPSTSPQVTPDFCSFKKETRSFQSWVRMIILTLDTARLAHISLKALKYIGPEYARDIFDVMAAMWGKRVLQLTRSSFTIQNWEQLNNLPGKIILVMNHKSQLDFVFTFFALSQIVRPSGRGIRPRFITAKDHFLDNMLVYEVVGVGKLIETVDMVFIERQRSKFGLQNLRQAAEFLSQKEIEIAIFPQGTRAAGNLDRSGKRRDAGYYTTVPPKDVGQDLGHLRKGTAYLAVDTLFEMEKTGQEDLHLVFIGIKGTATILAKSGLKLQTETDVSFVVGDPLTLSTQLLKNIRRPDEEAKELDFAERQYMDLVAEIHEKIDQHLVACLDIQQNLKHRFLLDIQGHFRYTQDRVELIENHLNNYYSDATVVYQILDRIYACPIGEWNSYLGELAQLIMDKSPVARLKTLRDQVTQAQLASTTKLHGKKVKPVYAPHT